MKRYKNLVFYFVTICFFSLLIYFTLRFGSFLEPGKLAQPPLIKTNSTKQQFIHTFIDSLSHPLSILLIQIITILIVARILGWVCKKIKQPSVVGEMVAGILLGPSFAGLYFHQFSAFLFPAASIGNLQFLSQIGLILFMFVVGMELDLNVLKNKAKDAVIISHASIIFPFSLGIILAYFIYASFAPANVRFIAFALFIGIAMSITAFPVLARIVQERDLNKTKLGAIVITCAAADDITAWCILAIVIAIAKAGSLLNASYTIAMALAFVFLMLNLVQPFLKKLGEKYSDKESFDRPVVAIFFIVLLISACLTEIIGIHALFGAFMAGVIMPANARFRTVFIEKIEDIALILLLPLFFVFTGLRTQIGLLNDIYLWKVCFIVIAVAVAGKFLGSTIAAKFVGQSWRESLSIGALMNTRGLMELVVLNIGYDLGVLSPQIFSMLVIMALATTFMTGPALNLIEKLFTVKKIYIPVTGIKAAIKYNLLICFSTPDRGIRLLQLANYFVKKSIHDTTVTMLHLSPVSELNKYSQQEYERENAEPVNREAQKLNINAEIVFKPTAEIDSDITRAANAGHFDWLLIGFGSSVYQGTLLGKILGFTNQLINPERLIQTIAGKEKLFEYPVLDERVRNIVRTTKIPVGIFLDKNLNELNNVVVPIFSISDNFLLIYMQRLIDNNPAIMVVILDIAGAIRQNPEMMRSIYAAGHTIPAKISIIENAVDNDFFSQQDLMLISLDSWKKAIDEQVEWLQQIPSALLLKP